MKQTAGTRRNFSAEFKHEAVLRMAERRAQGVTVKQIGRELDVRPEVLWAWKRQLDDQPSDALEVSASGYYAAVARAEGLPSRRSASRASCGKISSWRVALDDRSLPR